MKRFTLIELLVVIAILGILMTLLLPSLSSARKNAKTVLCMSNLRNVALIHQKFSKDNNNVIVQTYRKSATFYYGWDLSLRKYTDSSFSGDRDTNHPQPSGDNPAICPSYEDLTFVYAKAGGSAVQKPSFPKSASGSTSRHNGKYISYALNQFLGTDLMQPTGYPGRGTNGDGSWYSGYGKRWVYFAEIKTPSETMIFGESYDTARIALFEDAYFNPNHLNKLSYVKVDGSSSLLHYNSIVSNGKQPNSNNFNTMADWEIDFWGCYVSPKF
ncbi:MAG: type II secretion system GspH family protein [Lentisphaeraceae bacterium]|nr:type II secretion system GspH family protein [Lentisphaeraceae bacterium]